MDNIKVGDLVMVVRGHECVLTAIGGRVYVVLDMVGQTGGGWYCPKCQTRDLAQDELLAAKLFAEIDGGIPTGWLKKIPPISELGEVQSTKKNAEGERQPEAR